MKLHLRKSRIVVLLLAISIGSIGGCNSQVAKMLVEAPNAGAPERGIDAPADVLAEHRVSQQLRINVGPPPASLSVWIIDPIPVPADIRIDFDSAHGSKVHWSYGPSARPASPCATVFLLHGLGDNKEYFPYEFYSFILAGQGYRVVMVDSRGHGRSTGDRLTYGFRESRDLVQVLDELQRRGLIIGRVGVLGISYGASTAICWASIDSRVRAVVALEPFSSLRDAAADAGPILLGNTKWMFSRSDYQKIAMKVGRIGGFDIDLDSPLACIARCSTPILLIHGKADNFLRPIHSIRLHEADPDHSMLILVDGASHLDLWVKAVELISHESNLWFQRYLNTFPATRPAMRDATAGLPQTRPTE